jgi:hypothetical protein
LDLARVQASGFSHSLQPAVTSNCNNC